ncbi:hypothetical protein V3N99_12465 [Dermatophilaceae bacterium Soc4.6]
MGTLADAETRIREAAIRLVQEPGGGVRVEDYVATLAAATAEAALAAAGFDVEHHDLVPGSLLTYDAVRARLTGDPVTSPAPVGTVWSLLEPLAGRAVPESAFPDAAQLYAQTEHQLISAEPGTVVTTVGADHAPARPPLRQAYELRPAVLETERLFGAAVADRHVVTATALRSAIDQTKSAIDPAIALRLALEVLFGVARLAPMRSDVIATS